MNNSSSAGSNIGEYRLVKLLGSGGFGRVYLAERVNSSEQVALKVLQGHLLQQDDFRTFINEARAIRLRHPNIIPILDFGIDRDYTPFIAMEYAPRGTLRTRHPYGTRLTLYTVIEYASQIASALQYAHDLHIVHRDVKPENMLVRADGTILLSDFGITAIPHTTSSGMTNQGAAGTILYMAPEQLSGKPRAASDQYALATVIYEWLTGQTPFQGTYYEIASQQNNQTPLSITSQRPDISPEVEAVLFKALAKDYRDRFPSIQTFIDTLQQVANASTLYPPTLGPDQLSQVVAPHIFSPTPASEHGISQAAQPESQLPVKPPANVPSEAISDQQAPPSIASAPPQNHAPVPSIATPAPPARSRYSPPKNWPLFLILLILILIAASIYTYTTTNSTQRALQSKHISATSTTQAIYNASTYNNAVARQGMMFGFDATHTHNNPYETILNNTNVARLHQKWMLPTGDTIVSSPIVANGVIYIGSSQSKLYAFDIATGRKKWTASAGTDSGSIASSPALYNGMLYVGSLDGKVYAFDASNGQSKWIYTTPGTILSSPAVIGGAVYIGSSEGDLYAIDATNGHLKWMAPTNGSVKSSPAVANGMVYVSSDRGYLYAFDTIHGKQQWSISASSKGSMGSDTIDSSPTVANGTVYIGFQDGKLYTFDAANGQSRWTATTSGPIDSSPAIANNTVYIGSRDGKLYAFNATSGQPRWTTAVDKPIDSSPTIANNIVYLGTQNGIIHAFDAATGQSKWIANVGSASFSSPAVVNGTIYIGSDDGKLYAFSL